MRLAAAAPACPSRAASSSRQGYGAGLKPAFTRGFAYYDAWVDDARLVVLTLSSARAHGATVLARTRCTGARREGDAWRVTLREQASGKESEVRSRILVNAAGPWVKSLLDHELKIDSPGRVRLVKGSHIVVPRIHDKRHAYILQNPDRRVVFMIPYEREFTLIGTTDVPVTGEDIPAGDLARGGRLPVRGGEPLQRASGHHRSGGVELQRRAAVVRRRQRKTRRPSPATTCCCSTSRARRCYRCSAARSPPTASWPSM